MARVKTRYSRFCFLFCIAPMMIPFQSFMLTLVKVATTLHINGKIWGLAIIYWGLGAPMSIFLYQGFAKGIPLELEESALIDGCNQFQLFTRIIFPMLKSCTATVTIINVMWIWNDFLLPLLMLGGRKSSKTLQLAAYSFMGQYKMEWQKRRGCRWCRPGWLWYGLRLRCYLQDRRRLDGERRAARCSSSSPTTNRCPRCFRVSS